MRFTCAAIWEEQAGRRLYIAHPCADERLRDAATIPLLLWMIKTGGR